MTRRQFLIIEEFYVGTITLGKDVLISGTSDEMDSWCSLITECQPGNYYGYAVIVQENNNDTSAVKSLSIYKDDCKCEQDCMKIIGEIYVSNGLAGFHSNISKYFKSSIFSFTGYEKKYGRYKVYANDDMTAFMISYISDYVEYFVENVYIGMSDAGGNITDFCHIGHVTREMRERDGDNICGKNELYKFNIYETLDEAIRKAGYLANKIQFLDLSEEELENAKRIINELMHIPEYLETFNLKYHG